MQDKKISLVITHTNDFEKLIQSFNEVIEDNRISEIVVMGSKGNEDFENKLQDWLEYDAPEKIKLCTNQEPLTPEETEYRAVLFADQEYLLLSDQNQVIHKQDVDKIFTTIWGYDITFPVSQRARFINRKHYLQTHKQ